LALEVVKYCISHNFGGAGTHAGIVVDLKITNYVIVCNHHPCAKRVIIISDLDIVAKNDIIGN
jgi:hypothetical protein